MPAQAGIQYAVPSRFELRRRGILDRPVKPGDDIFLWSLLRISMTLLLS
jgi:hypothetical protein